MDMTPTFDDAGVGQRSIVEACMLTRRFGSLTAVDELDFTVPTGAIFGLLGTNGAGKRDAG